MRRMSHESQASAAISRRPTTWRTVSTEGGMSLNHLIRCLINMLVQVMLTMAAMRLMRPTCHGKMWSCMHPARSSRRLTAKCITVLAVILLAGTRQATFVPELLNADVMDFSIDGRCLSIRGGPHQA